MSTDYDRIRKDNIREYGQGTRHLSFLGRLYTDRTHFVFELLQNAEDAGATRILFSLFDDRLEVTHDGRLFNERDVRGVCGVGEGTKTEDLTQIGKFGIGFKSVYAYTATPEVHSGGEGFRIENYVRPYAVTSKPAGNSWTTLFVFPFNTEEIAPETACKEIGARLRNLSARSLLFLRKIAEIEYKLPDSTGGVYLRDEVARGPARQVSVIGYNNGRDEEETWVIFERPVPLPGEAEDVRVEVSFRLGTEVKNEKKEERIFKIKESPLVVYFPTEKETRFGFLIQGPYRTTPSRDNIPKDDDWNAVLVAETSHLLTEVLPQIKQLGLLTVSFLEALPIRMDDFPEDNMFYPIVVSVRNALQNEDLLPADDGSFVSAKKSKLARGADLRELINQDQLRQLSQSVEEIKWLTGEITQDKTPDLRSYLIKELDVEEVTPDGFSRKISRPFLLGQLDDWIMKFYRYLSGQEALWRSPRWRNDQGGLLRAKPILRLENGNHVIPFRSDGSTTYGFLPPPEETDLPIVKRSIASDEQSRTFLKRLGFSEPDVFDDIVARVLPKYIKTHEVSVSQEEHTADIQKILRAMGSDSDSGKKKVIQAARQAPFLKAINFTGEMAFKKPTEIYLNVPDLRRYFAELPSIWYLHEEYPSSERDISIWRGLGVAGLPRKLLTTEGLHHDEMEYSTREETIENYDLDGLAQFLENISNISDFTEQKNNAFVLWRFLAKYLEQDARFFKGRYQWFYYSPQSKYFNSMMLGRLRSAQWIPTTNETLAKPGEISTDQLLEECAGASELIESLGIAEGADRGGLTEEEKKREHATEFGVTLENIEFLKNHPEEIERLKAAIAARKEQPSFPLRPVTKPERREERLGDQLSDAPEKQYEKRERSVRTTSGAIDPITWLKNQYMNESDQMICQICKEEMPFKKRNGEHYFEKKEVLSKKFLSKEHEAQYLALCPLCAAMYEEFVKNDEDTMVELREKLVSTDNGDVPITLGDQETSIRFVETHFHDLKIIVEGSA